MTSEITMIHTKISAKPKLTMIPTKPGNFQWEVQIHHVVLCIAQKLWARHKYKHKNININTKKFT